MSEKKERVVIVDDHPLFRERLELINQELDMEICGEAEDAQQAIELIRNISPDLVIVDITLKSSSGLELIKSTRAKIKEKMNFRTATELQHFRHTVGARARVERVFVKSNRKTSVRRLGLDQA